jgi:peptidyl-prolyl cis-trans isomerase SurA
MIADSSRPFSRVMALVAALATTVPTASWAQLRVPSGAGNGGPSAGAPSLAPVATPAAAASDAAAPAQPAARAKPSAPTMVDYIVAVVNNELVTEIEVQQRMDQIRIEASRNNQTPPAGDALRNAAVQALINERLEVSAARDTGITVDDADLDRAVDNIASMNKITVGQLKEKLKEQGMDYVRFRANLRDQILASRVREREVQRRINITEAEIDDYLAKQRKQSANEQQLDIAQILVTVPDGASDAVVAGRRALIDKAQARLKAGEPFAKVAQDMSEDANKANGGEIGPKPASRLPDLFVSAVKGLAVGAVTPQPLRSGAGFHLLKLISRSDSNPDVAIQTRARHILLRPSAQLSVEDAKARLSEMRARILSGQAKFEDLAREYSEDGSASRGGDLGWASPGSFVPEFEATMNNLPVGGISTPIVSRFGVHLIQVTDRREVKVDRDQIRAQARNAIGEQKYDAAYDAWLEELRNNAFIEMREPPL